MMEKISIHILQLRDVAPYFLKMMETGGIVSLVEAEHMLSSGKFYSVAPEDVGIDRLIDFERGGIIASGEKKYLDGYVVQQVQNSVRQAAYFVSQEMVGLGVVNAYVHEPLLNEVELIDQRLDFIKIDGKIYLKYEIYSVDDVEKMIRNSLLSWHFLSYITDSAVPFISVDEVCHAAKFVLVGAYDGESVLYWKRG